MAKRSRKKKKPAAEKTEAEEAALAEEIDAEALDEEGDEEGREGDDRRRGNRRKRGRRIGPAVWLFAFFSLLIGFYGGYTVWTEFRGQVIGGGLPTLQTMRQTRAPHRAPDNFTIQFQSFTVRSTIGGDSVRVAITPYVEARNEADLAAICENHSAVQYAIREVLNRQLRDNKGAETNYQAATGEMLDEINRLLAAKLVTGVRIVPWKPPRSGTQPLNEGAPRLCGGFGR